MKQEIMRWQWHQLDHVQIICTLLQTDNQASTLPLSFFTGRVPFLPPNQQRQSTEANRVVNQVMLGWWCRLAPHTAGSCNLFAAVQCNACGKFQCQSSDSGPVPYRV